MTEPSPEEGAPPETPSEIPTETKKRPWLKIVAVIVVIAVIVSAFAAYWFVFRGVSVQSVSLAGESVQNVGESLTFTAAADGPISSYEWAFGDGQTTSTATNTVTHAYGEKGTYLVLLTVKGSAGQTATNDPLGLLQVGITNPGQNLKNESAMAVAFASPNTIQPSGSVNFDGNSSYGFDWNAANFNANRFPFFSPNRAKIVSLNWTWGDGSTVLKGNDSAARKPSHTYASGGLYAVKLTAMSMFNMTDDVYVSIRVASSTGVIKNPNTFVVGSIGDPQYLDPAIDYETTGGEYIKNVYDRLVTRSVDLTDPANPVLNSSKIVGMVAESWTSSSDGYWWNFTIKHGVVFSDGTPLTAQDVVFSFQRVLIENRGPAWILDQSMTAYASDDPATPINERWAAINESIKATDDYHVTFHLAMPSGAFLQTLDFEVASIVSKAWVTAHGGVQWRARNQDVERNMMGSGPFMLDHWTPGVEFKLVANPNYWGTPKPKLAAVLSTIVLDPATQELLIKNGDIDRAQGIPQKDITMVDAYDGVDVARDPSLTVQYIGFSINNSWPGDPARLVNTSPFRDVHVRRALSMVIDYETIQTTILAGFGYQLKSPVPDGMPGYTGEWWNYGSATLAQAKAEMALADPSLRNGFNSEMWYNTGNPTREQISVLVQANAALLNINLTIRAVSWPQLLSANDFRQAPMFILAWAPDYLDPDDYVFPLVHSSQCPQWIEGTTPPPGESTAGTAAACYQNATVDQLIEDAQVELNPATRMQMYSTIQKAFVQDAAWIFLYQPVALNPMRTWVKGWYYDPMALWDFQYIYK